MLVTGDDTPSPYCHISHMISTYTLIIDIILSPTLHPVTTCVLATGDHTSSLVIYLVPFHCISFHHTTIHPLITTPIHHLNTSCVRCLRLQEGRQHRSHGDIHRKLPITITINTTSTTITTATTATAAITNKESTIISIMLKFFRILDA